MEESKYDHLKHQTDAEELLWHYTDWNGLRGVFENKEIWATHFSYLNDTHEVLHALKIAGEEFRDSDVFFQNRVLGMLRGEEALPAFYVASFSKAFDSLEQWRAYSSDSLGFALGIDRQHLNHIADSYEMRLETCVYDDDELRGATRKFVEQWRERCRQVEKIADDTTRSALERHTKPKAWAEQQRIVPGQFIGEISRFKNKCFVNECEVRLTSLALSAYDWQSLSPALTIDFRRRGNLVVPYLKVPLKLPAELKGLSYAKGATPIRAVLLGPMAKSSLNMRAVEGMFRNSSIGSIDVASSKIPLR